MKFWTPGLVHLWWCFHVSYLLDTIEVVDGGWWLIPRIRWMSLWIPGKLFTSSILECNGHLFKESSGPIVNTYKRKHKFSWKVRLEKLPLKSVKPFFLLLHFHKSTSMFKSWPKKFNYKTVDIDYYLDMVVSLKSGCSRFILTKNSF